MPHVACATSALNVPGAQSVAASLPTLQNVPLGHVVHWLALLIMPALIVGT